MNLKVVMTYCQRDPLSLFTAVHTALRYIRLLTTYQSMTNFSSVARRILSEDERKMYAAETKHNFRWISQLVATYSPHTLTSADRLPPELELWIAEIGQK